MDNDKDSHASDKDKTEKDKTDEDKKAEHAKEIAAAVAYIAAEDAKDPSPEVYAVLAVINRTPGMKIPGKPYNAEKNPQGEGHYDIYFNPDVYKGYSEGKGNDSYHGRTKEEYESLAKDPAQGGKITDKTKREREVGLSLEKEGKLKPLIEREPTGASEFIDGDGVEWDIKSFNSNYPSSKGGFDLDRDAKNILSEIQAGENVIIDTINLKAEHIASLKERIKQLGLSDKVIFY